jgi:GntR family transcriptional regulator
MRRELSERILLGHWAPGAVLPGEVALAAQFGVAVGTVRRALAALVAEGMLVRRPRIGAVVTVQSPEHSPRFFVRYFRLHGTDGSLQTSRAVTNLLREEPAGE